MPIYKNTFGKNFLFALWTYGRIEIQFQHMSKPPFDKEEKRRELAHRLSKIKGIDIPDEALSKRPSFALDLLTNSDALETFLNTFDWVLNEIMKAEQVSPNKQ